MKKSYQWLPCSPSPEFRCFLRSVPAGQNEVIAFLREAPGVEMRFRLCHAESMARP
jgi:hypothetical protein